MKRLIIIIFLIFITIPKINAINLPVEVTASSAILVNLDEDEIIYEKEPEKVQILASLTKIMTAYTAIKNIDDLNAYVTITEQDINNLEGFTVAGINIGDKLTYLDLLHGTILLSAADTSKALANHIAGSETEFVKLMNFEARKLNLRNTNFEDSYGGHDDNKATAREIAILLKTALKNETFKKVFTTTYYTMSNNIRVVNYTHSIATYHGLDYTVITGSKSGFTPEAGYLLASTATINNTNYMAIVMNCPQHVYKQHYVLDTYRIYDYIKERNYEKRTIIKKGTLIKTIKVVDGLLPEYSIYLDEDITKFLNDEEYNNITIEYNLVNKINNTSNIGDSLGFIDIKLNNEIIESKSIQLKDSLFKTNKKESKNTLLIPIISMSTAFFICVILTLRLFFKYKK